MADRSCDLVIIGGGIVGLAVALQASRRMPSLKIVVLEKETGLARHQSGHNSGVIHSGLYYKPGSLKARLCVEGAAAMIEFCKAYNIPYQLCGKVVVATSESELPVLAELESRGRANGVPGLRAILKEELREIEPHASGIGALHVASTGITDYRKVVEAYAELVKQADSEVLTGAEVLGIVRDGSKAVVETTVGTVQAKFLINCAGLQSDRIARMAGEELDIRIVPFRGEYYEVIPERRFLVRSLIYPVPDPRFPFLGVHFTNRVDGSVEAGPNAVLAFKREGYSRHSFNFADTSSILSWPGFWAITKRYWKSGLGEFHRSYSKAAFTRALQTLVPEIRASDIQPAGAGVRAQALHVSGALVDDFAFYESPQMLHVLNVPSPAATASLAIAREIVSKVEARFELGNKQTPGQVITA